MSVLKNILVRLNNKYVLVLLCFIAWMLFFDPKDLGTVFARANKVEDLKQSEKQISAQISTTKAELKLLKTNANTIEKYAREKYYMKKDNEDLFIVQPPVEK